MNGPGEWELDYRTALRELVGAYTHMLNARMEFQASGGAAWLAAAGWEQARIDAIEQSLTVFGKVEATLLSNPVYIPTFYAVRNGDLPPALPPEDPTP